jgi:hypothetical protein
VRQKKYIIPEKCSPVSPQNTTGKERRDENSHDRSSLIFFYHRTAIGCWLLETPGAPLDENVNFLIIWERVVWGSAA